MPCSMVRSDRAEAREGWRARQELIAGWCSLSPGSICLCYFVPPLSLFPNMVPGVFLLFFQAQVKWNILCLMENDRSWEGTGVTSSTGHCPHLNQPLWMPPQGADVPTLPGSSELDSPAHDLVW